MKGDQIDREGWSVPLKYTSVALYPLWYLLNIVPEASLSDILIKLLRIILFLPAENMVGAMWFVPFLALALGIFHIVLFIYDKMFSFKYFNDSLFLIIILVFGFIGGALVLNYGIGRYYLFIAILMQPIILVGYMGKNIVVLIR